MLVLFFTRRVKQNRASIMAGEPSRQLLLTALEDARAPRHIFIMDLRTCSHDFIIEFINGFQDSPCLWQTKSSDYKNKGYRLTAYNKLVEIAKKYEPNSNIASVKKKIQSLRASHRKERNKVIASMRTGSGVENVYQPKLWYYKELEFLNDPVQSTASISTIESDDDDGENRSQVSSQDSLDNISSPPPSVNSVPQRPSQTPSPSTTPELPSFSRKRKDDTSNQMFRLITQRLSQQEDDFDIFGRNVASKLRTMTTEQKIFAEKLINDVIFNGQMELLSINSVINVRSENLHNNTNYNFNNQPFYKPAPAPVNTSTRSSIFTSTTRPQYRILTATDDQQINTPAPENFTSIATTQPQFQVMTATDDQQINTPAPENFTSIATTQPQFQVMTATDDQQINTPAPENFTSIATTQPQFQVMTATDDQQINTPAPENFTSIATTQPQFQVMTATDDQQINTPAPENFTSIATTQPQFQVMTATDDQQYNPENSNSLAYFVSNFSA